MTHTGASYNASFDHSWFIRELFTSYLIIVFESSFDRNLCLHLFFPLIVSYAPILRSYLFFLCTHQFLCLLHTYQYYDSCIYSFNSWLIKTRPYISFVWYIFVTPHLVAILIFWWNNIQHAWVVVDIEITDPSRYQIRSINLIGPDRSFFHIYHMLASTSVNTSTRYCIIIQYRTVSSDWYHTVPKYLHPFSSQVHD